MTKSLVLAPLGITLIALACLIALLVYPVKSVVCPAWRIQVVDDAGKPLKHTYAEEVWRDYSVESDDHSEDSYTDGDGYVSFPERTIRASRLSRTSGCLVNVLSQAVHASCGAHAYVLAYSEAVGNRRHEGSARYEDGKPLPARLETYVSHP